MKLDHFRSKYKTGSTIYFRKNKGEGTAFGYFHMNDVGTKPGIIFKLHMVITSGLLPVNTNKNMQLKSNEDFPVLQLSFAIIVIPNKHTIRALTRVRLRKKSRNYRKNF